MKKLIRSIPVFMLIGILFVPQVARASEVQPRYIEIASITSGLTISNTGKASCSGTASLWDDYTAKVTVELKQDGTTIKTWSSTGTAYVAAGGDYYVESGHVYVVTTTVTVYNANGGVIESPSKDSPSKFY